MDRSIREELANLWIIDFSKNKSLIKSFKKLASDNKHLRIYNNELFVEINNLKENYVSSLDIRQIRIIMTKYYLLYIR